MTIAESYNSEAKRLLTHMAESLAADPAIATANEIDDIVFRRSEYLGGRPSPFSPSLNSRIREPDHDRHHHHPHRSRRTA